VNGKEYVVHTHNGILFSHKNGEILLFAATLMEMMDIMVSETLQAWKDKYLLFLFIPGC
jgi:hypothetical protein